MDETPALVDAPSARRAQDGSPHESREELARVRGRDPRALDAFFEAHFDRIWGLVFRLLGHREAAEDVVQETFYRAHRSIDRLDPERDPRAWLVAIAMNVCRDFWKSAPHRAAARAIPYETAAAELEARGRDPAGSPEDAALRGERDLLVQHAILRLDPDLRAALVLREYQEMSHEEIARTLGISHAAARKRYSRALAALAVDLRERLA